MVFASKDEFVRLFLNCALVLLLCMFFRVPSVSAAMVLHQNFDNLVSNAEAVVAGTVQKTDCRYLPDNKIYTFVTLGDLQIVLGEYDRDKLVLRLKGGQIGHKGTMVFGSPRFNPGDRVVLFISGNGENVVPIVGWTQGIFKSVKDPVSEEDVITDYEGSRIFGIRGGDFIKERGNAENANISPGVNEDGSTPKVREREPSLQYKKTLSSLKFIEMISDAAAKQAKPHASIKSVEIPDSTDQQAEDSKQ